MLIGGLCITSDHFDCSLGSLLFINIYIKQKVKVSTRGMSNNSF